MTVYENEQAKLNKPINKIHYIYNIYYIYNGYFLMFWLFKFENCHLS